MHFRFLIFLVLLNLLSARSACQTRTYYNFHGSDPAAFLEYLAIDTAVNLWVIDPDSLPRLTAKDVALLIRKVNSTQIIPPVYSNYSTSMWARKHIPSTIGVEAMRWIYAFRKEKKYPWLKYPSAASSYDAVICRYRKNALMPRHIKVAEIKMWWFLNKGMLLRQ